MLFQNRFGYCKNSQNFSVSKSQVKCKKKIRKIIINYCLKCGQENWKVHPSNFDNVYNSFLTLLGISTMDDWSDVLLIAVNSNLPEFVSVFYFCHV